MNGEAAVQSMVGVVVFEVFAEGEGGLAVVVSAVVGGSVPVDDAAFDDPADVGSEGLG
jgi:hypothetical protein